MLDRAEVKLELLREDLNHPLVSGNKWWKLKHNLLEAKALHHHTLLTFGGAYSNHIHATAAAAQLSGFRSIGIIRGEETLPLNRTLAFASAQGMNLLYVDRVSYRMKSDPEWIRSITKSLGACYIIPEGGSNKLAIRGCTDWGIHLEATHNFDFLCLPVGTGGTISGLVQGLSREKTIIGISVLKNGQFLNEQIKQWLETKACNWKIVTEYDWGGYAKSNDELDLFIRDFKTNHGVPLEFVYSGKMMAGVWDLIGKGFFPKGSRILALHTGGLQASAD